MRYCTIPWPLLIWICVNHDDVIKWKHFPRYWPFVRGIHRGPVTRSFDVFFDLRLNKRLSNDMVIYSLRRVCGGRTATLVPQTVQRPYGFYANRTATSRFLARRKVIASLAVFLKLDNKLFSETAMPQPHRKITVRGPYGRLAMTMRWHTVFTLFWVPRRKSHGGLAAAIR